MDYIISLIFDYSYKLLYADIDFINRIVQYVLKQRNLGYLVEDLDIDKYIKGDSVVALLANAAYDFSNKRLLFSTVNINFSTEYLLEELEKKVDLNNFERCFYNNMFVAQTVLHELEHVNQRSSNIKNKIEREILNQNQSGECLLGNYDYCPKERYAEIKSWLLLKSGFKGINIKYLNIYIVKKIYQELLRGYTQKENPLYKYCAISNIECPIISISASPYIRMYHGLDITIDEYQYVKKRV